MRPITHHYQIFLACLLSFSACKSEISTENKVTINNQEVNNSSSEDDEKDSKDKEGESSDTSKTTETNDSSNNNAANSNTQANSTNSPNENTGNTIPKTLTASDINPPNLLQETESIITLPYNQGDGFGADSCELSNLDKIVLSTACSCAAATCTAGLTGIEGYAGPASFDFLVKEGEVSSSLATATLVILPDLVDDDVSSTGFAAAGFNNAQYVSAVELLEWDDDKKLLQYDDMSNSITDNFDTTGLEAYWRFDGTIGATLPSGSSLIIDRSGNDMHGSLSVDTTTPEYAEGKLNSAVYIAGDASRINGSGSLSFSNAYTIILWFKAAGTPGGTNQQTHIPFTHFVGSNSYLGISNNTGRVTAYHRDGSNASIGVNSIDTLDLSKWNQIAWTYENNEVSIWLNGSLDVVQTVTGVTATRSPWIISTNSPSNKINGYIDEVMFFSRKLGPDEITSLYQRQAGTFGGTEQGVFTSRLLNSGTIDSGWNEISWVPSAPYGKELPAGVDGHIPAYDATNAETAYAQGNADASLLNSLIGYWRLNGTLGASVPTTAGSVIDFSGKENHGQLYDGGGTAPTFQTGKLNQSIAFDGADDYIDMGNPADLQLAGNFTTAFWVKFSGSARGTILSRNEDNLSVRGYRIIADDPVGGHAIGLQVSSDCSDEIFMATPPPIVPNDTWLFATAVLELGVSMRIYYNGKLVATDSGNVPSTLCAANGQNFLIGRQANSGGGAYFFEGQLDEITMWNRVLTDNEIEQLYLRGALGLKFQVAGCQNADCSDGIFVGPDGTGSSYFSESASSAPGLPTFSIAPPLQGRYLQYKGFLDTGNSDYSPALQSIQLGVD